MKVISKFDKVQVHRSRFNQLQELVRKRIDEKSLNQLFKESGLRFGVVQYQMARYLIFAVWFVTQIITIIFSGLAASQIEIWLLLFIVSSPRISIFNQRTPFKIVFDLLIDNHRYKKNLEIFRAVTQLKNLAIIKQKNPPGAEFILEQLRKFTQTTRPIFNRMISLWNVGRKEEACEYFKQAINTKEGEELANFFLKLDSMNPVELKNQLILFQEVVKRERETHKLNRNKNRSYVYYAAVSIASFAALINFITVAVFIDVMDSLKSVG